MVKKRVGFIGFGGQAAEQAEFVNQTESGVVVAISDVNLAIKDSMLDEFLALPFYVDYKEMILSEDLDVVFIAIPHYLHAEASMFAIEHGVEVIKEKPLAMNMLEGQQIVNLSKQKQVSIKTLTQRRQHDAFIFGKSLLSKLGDVNLIKAEYTFNGGPYDYGWRGIQRIAGGGAAFDMGYHILDVLLWYFDTPKYVNALLKSDSRKDVSYETEDSGIISFVTNSGALGNVFLSRATSPKKEELIIYGSEGILDISRSRVILKDQKGNLLIEKNFDKSWDNSIIGQLELFFEDSSNEHGDEHLKHLRLLEAIYQSNDLLKTVEV